MAQNLLDIPFHDSFGDIVIAEELDVGFIKILQGVFLNGEMLQVIEALVLDSEHQICPYPGLVVRQDRQLFEQIRKTVGYYVAGFLHILDIGQRDSYVSVPLLI